MNERTQQLAVNAGLYVDLAGQPWPKSMSAEECEAAYQKFAESIVGECASIVYKTDTDHADGLALLLLHTFGVEE